MSFLTHRQSIPVYADIWRGFGITRGMLVIEQNRLYFEFQSTDKLLAILRSGLTVREIPLLAIVDFRIERVGFWSSLFGKPRLELQFNSMTAGLNLPGNESGLLQLKVPRHARAALLKFADALRHAKAIATHDAINDDLYADRARQSSSAMPPPMSPQLQQEHPWRSVERWIDRVIKQL